LNKDDAYFPYDVQESMLNFLSDISCNTPMSLHIPLHRTLSAILAKLVLLPWKDAKDGFLSSLNFGYSEKEVRCICFVAIWSLYLYGWNDLCIPERLELRILMNLFVGIQVLVIGDPGFSIRNTSLDS